MDENFAGICESDGDVLPSRLRDEITWASVTAWPASGSRLVSDSRLWAKTSRAIKSARRSSSGVSGGARASAGLAERIGASGAGVKDCLLGVVGESVDVLMGMVIGPESPQGERMPQRVKDVDPLKQRFFQRDREAWKACTSGKSKRVNAGRPTRKQRSVSDEERGIGADSAHNRSIEASLTSNAAAVSARAVLEGVRSWPTQSMESCAGDFDVRS